MTQTPDEPNEPDEGREPPDPASDGVGDGVTENAQETAGQGRDLDEDAAWRDIVAHYGDRPAVEDAAGPSPRERTRYQAPRRRSGPPRDPGGQPGRGDRDERLRGLFQPSWNDPLDSSASWDDESHFIPPDPPPVRVADPRRRAAWAGLFGAPLLMLVAVVLGWQLPGWAMLGLAGGFTGGFVYLVATMSDRRGPGDDGAVV